MCTKIKSPDQQTQSINSEIKFADRRTYTIILFNYMPSALCEERVVIHSLRSTSNLKAFECGGRFKRSVVYRLNTRTDVPKCLWFQHARHGRCRYTERRKQVKENRRKGDKKERQKEIEIKKSIPMHAGTV